MSKPQLRRLRRQASRAAKRRANRKRTLTSRRALTFEQLEDRRVLATYAVTGFADGLGPVTPSGTVGIDFDAPTLRAAIVDANSISGADTIVLAAGTYTLSLPGALENGALSGDLDITDDLTISGADAATTVIDATALGDRVLHVIDNPLDPQFPSTVSILDVTITGGLATDGGLSFFGAAAGGGILNDEFGATITIADSIITSNVADGTGLSLEGFGGGLADFGGNLTITNTEITNNEAKGAVDPFFPLPGQGGKGGGIYKQFPTTALLIDSSISGNKAIGGDDVGSGAGVGQGGGIYSDGVTWQMVGSTTVDSNQARGGNGSGLAGSGGGDAAGGGIYDTGGTWDLTLIPGSTISRNEAIGGSGDSGGDAFGGGIFGTQFSTWNLENNTISGNSALGGAGDSLAGGDAFGGGVYSTDFNTFTVTHLTIAANHATAGAGGIEQAGGFFDDGSGQIYLKSTIVATNLAALDPDLSGSFIGDVNIPVSTGFNLIGDIGSATGVTDALNGNQVGGDLNPIILPLLGPLQNNGGPTETHALLAGSPAIDAADPVLFPDFDQRGTERPDGDMLSVGLPDIGAFEVVSEAPVVEIAIQKLTNGVDGAIVSPGDPITFTYDVTNPGNVPLSNVEVVDDNGTPLNLGDDFNPDPVLDVTMTYNIGDVNSDDKLDTTETWQYVWNSTALDLGILIDFETDDQGSPLTAGTVIDDEYEDFGLTVSGSPTIFDSSFPALDPLGLVSLLNFNETSGTTAADTSGQGNNNFGTLDPLVGGPTWTGGTLDFDGVDDRVLMAASSDINLFDVAQRSIYVRFKADNAGSGKQVLYEEGSTSRGLNIYIDSGQLYVGGWNIPGGVESAWAGTYLNTAVSSGVWHEAVLVLNGGLTVGPDAIKGYLDGNLFGSGSGSQVWSHSGAIGIGATNGQTIFHDGVSAVDSHFFDGEIDELRISNPANLDLGTPNEDFGGPGVGAGGAAGAPGENRNGQDNVLFLDGGGTITFDFDAPVRINNIGLLDVDTAGGTIELYSDAGTTLIGAPIPISNLGDNSFQIIVINTPGVMQMKVNVPGGKFAVTKLDYDLTFMNIGTASGQFNPTATASDESSYSNPLEVSIEIEKSTQGQDADTGQGPVLLTGTQADFEYLVTNTGQVSLGPTAGNTTIFVTDDNGGGTPFNAIFVGGDNNGNTFLDLEETWTYQASRTVTAGQFTNIGSVAAADPLQEMTVTASDPSNHFGAAPDIAIEKTTNGGDGLNIPVGNPITWSYVVTNTGNVDLDTTAGDTITVTDDQGVIPVFVPASDTGVIGVLEVGESWTYQATGVAAAGLYSNEGRVDISYADDVGGNRTDFATDTSSYFGVLPAIDLEKFTRVDVNPIDIQKLVRVESPAIHGDLCDVLGNPVAITFQYNPGITVNTAQAPDKAKITFQGGVDDDGVSYVVVTDEDDPHKALAGDGKVYFSSEVAFGDLFAANEDVDSFGSTTYIHFFDDASGGLLQSVTYHTSCSQPIQLGDVIGNARLAGYAGENGSAEVADLGPGVNDDDADLPTGPAAAIGDTVVFTYVVSNPIPETELSNVQVTDQVLAPIESAEFFPDPVLEGGFNVGDTDMDHRLDSGEQWLYVSNTVVTEATPPGQHIDIATAIGTKEDGGVVTDMDRAHFLVGGSGFDCETRGPIGGIDLGDLTSDLFFFADGGTDANWQGATKGFVGNVSVNGIVADERTSGGVPFAGTIFTNDSTLDAWQDVVDQNPQATASTGNVTLIADKAADLNAAFVQINGLTATAGYESVTSTSLDGLNTLDGFNETFVINVTSGFNVSTQIDITGDAGDVFVLRWDTDANFTDGYEGQVKFQSGGAIVPGGNLTASNFIHVAGDINASGGGSTPAAPYPQGPRFDNGQGALIDGGSNFSGGGFFTGYWLTTGAPTNPADSTWAVRYGATASLSNAIFVGGWYTISTKFSLTSGTSGVHVCPNPATQPVETGSTDAGQKILFQVDDPFDSGNIGEDADNPTGPIAQPGDRVTYTYRVSNPGSVALTIKDLTDDNETPGDPSDDFTPAPVLVDGFNFGDANMNNLVDPGEFWYFQVMQIATDFGQHTNTAKVTAEGPALAPLMTMFQAEDFDSAQAPWQVFNAPDAAGGQYIAAPNGTGSNYSLPPKGSSVDYTFSVDVDGKYGISGLVNAPSGNDNSFWVQLDGGEWLQWHTNITAVNDFVWQPVTEGSGMAEVTFDLSAGQHSLAFKVREDGTGLDKIMVSQIGSTGPMVMDLDSSNHIVNPLAIEKYVFVATPAGDGVDLCDEHGKPLELTFRYTGGGEEATSTAQPDGKYDVIDAVPGGPNEAQTVFIRSTDKSNATDLGGKIFFTGIVDLDTEFTIAGAFGSNTFMHIFDSAGTTLLQTVQYHTSCSAPIVLGDIVGGVTLSGYLGEDGEQIDLNPGGALGDPADSPSGPVVLEGDEVVFNYGITNLGNVALTNVVVTDDQGLVPTFVDGDHNHNDLLDPGETWIFTASYLVDVPGQQMNLGTVTANSVQEPGGDLLSQSDPAYHFVESIKFFVVDAGEDATYRYTESGQAIDNFDLQNDNSDPRGAAALADGSMLWVLDKDRNENVYVYDRDGNVVGAWQARKTFAENDRLPDKVQGIATDGSNIWIVEQDKDFVYFYSDGASFVSGPHDATSKFALHEDNDHAFGITTDGVSIWVVDDDGSNNRVFKYSVGGNYLGSWSIDPANDKPRGITIDPTGGTSIWVVDQNADQIFQYDGATGLTSGSKTAHFVYNLDPENDNAEGIADPPPQRRQQSSEPSGDLDTLLSSSPAGFGVFPDFYRTPANLLGTRTEKVFSNGGFPWASFQRQSPDVNPRPQTFVSAEGASGQLPDLEKPDKGADEPLRALDHYLERFGEGDLIDAVFDRLGADASGGLELG